MGRLHTIPCTQNINVRNNYEIKLRNRYKKDKKLYDTFPNSRQLYLQLSHYLSEYIPTHLGAIHGDPVFTNILQTETQIKFIDMRGKQGDELTIFGDIYYDYAKIYQSILGYDFILNDLEIDNVYVSSFKSIFESRFTLEELNYIKLITASLFFTLLPLHQYSKEKFEKYFKIIENLIYEFQHNPN